MPLRPACAVGRRAQGIIKIMADSTLQDIKDRLNIVDVIGGYLTLKKSGVNYKVPCPFHNEKTASLMVSPTKQIWHCFGCGEGGDIFGFVMRYENLEFREALKVLAAKAGVQLPQFSKADPKVKEEKDLLFRINNFSALFYNQVLKSKQGEAAMVYLKSRGLTEGTIEKWRIGYAPDDFHALERALATKKVTPAQMILAGVSVKNDSGQVYDRFRGRITFPIFNYFGEVVGFTARVLKDDPNAPKYINSPETEIYNKSQVLFGLNFAKDLIRKKDELVIVEGQMDCISLHQAGFENVVASSGTAYNETAAGFTTARRLTQNIKLCFDSDSAGQNALRKTGELLLRLGFKIKVIVLKAVKDPDELVRKSPGLWEKAVREAVWFLDYYIDLAASSFPANSVEQKLFMSEQVVPYLGFIQDPLEQDHYIRKMAEKFSISEKVIRDNITKPNVGIPSDASPSTSVSQYDLLEKEVLGGVLKFKEFADFTIKAVKPEDFTNPEIGGFINDLLGGRQPAKEFLDSVLAKEAVFMVEFELALFDDSEDVLIKKLQKSFYSLKVYSIKRQHENLSFAIKRAESSNTGADIAKLKQEFAALGTLLLEYQKKN